MDASTVQEVSFMGAYRRELQKNSYTKVKKPVVDKGKEQVLVDEQTQAAPVHIETGECSKQSPVVSQTPHHTVVSSKERDRKKERMDRS